MRIKKSFLNAISGSVLLIIRSVLMFLVRIVLVKTLGDTYLGVDSLFTNVILVLSIADSGISTAINFSLYKPLSDKDYKKVSILMSYYKKMYRVLGFIVLGIGIVFIPFLTFVIRESINNIYIYYVIYLLTTVVPYFLSYKDSLLTADQNLYQSSLILGITYILLYVLRIVFLLIIPSFLIYSIILFVITVLQRLLVNRYITKKYPHISFDEKENLPEKEKKHIVKSVKSVFLNKLGYYLVSGTDNLIISALPNLGLTTVAIYTNYYSVIGIVDTTIAKGLSGITSSFGDLAVNESKQTQESVYDIISFISFIIFGLFMMGLLFLLTPFIRMCFGSSFEISNSILIVICITLYLNGMIKPLDIIKEATGNYIKDRYVNIIQAGINIVLSIVLGRMYGLFGVVIATLISILVLPFWNRPYIAYKYIFNKKPYKFFLKQLIYAITLVVIYFTCKCILSYTCIDNMMLYFIINGFIILVIYILIVSVLFFKTKEYKYVINLLPKKRKSN